LITSIFKEKIYIEKHRDRSQQEFADCWHNRGNLFVNKRKPDLDVVLSISFYTHTISYMCYKSNKEKAKQSIPQHEMNHMAKLAIDKKNSRFIDSIEISICDEFNRNKIAYNYRISDYKYK